MKTDFAKKQAKYRAYRQQYDRQQLRTIKLIAGAVKRIIKNNNKNLSNNDIKELCLTVYGKYDKIKHVRVRNQLSQEAIQTSINTALIEFYSSAGIDKEEAVKLLNLAKEIAKEKKDVTNLLKIVEKYENAANLTHKNTITARTTETIDYSKLGKDGNPVQKVTKTLEVTQDASIADAQNGAKTRQNTEAHPENEPKTQEENG